MKGNEKILEGPDAKELNKLVEAMTHFNSVFYDNSSEGGAWWVEHMVLEASSFYKRVEQMRKFPCKYEKALLRCFHDNPCKEFGKKFVESLRARGDCPESTLKELKDALKKDGIFMVFAIDTLFREMVGAEKLNPAWPKWDVPESFTLFVESHKDEKMVKAAHEFIEGAAALEKEREIAHHDIGEKFGYLLDETMDDFFNHYYIFNDNLKKLRLLCKGYGKNFKSLIKG